MKTEETKALWEELRMVICASKHLSFYILFAVCAI